MPDNRINREDFLRAVRNAGEAEVDRNRNIHNLDNELLRELLETGNTGAEELEREIRETLQERVDELAEEEREIKQEQLVENWNWIKTKIHTLNIKKGDVLVLRTSRRYPAKVLVNIKKNIHEIINIPILVIPMDIKMEVLRLEEWFV
jgi:hypothetical protein